MTKFESGYALVIGIGDYQHLSRLAKAPIDAQELAQVLVQQCGYPPEHVALLLDAAATKPAINDKLEWLAKQTTKDNTVVIFFAGHGAQSIHPATPGEYLCPVETTFEDIQNKAISSTEFSAALHKINARKVVVFFDACHSGGVGEIRDATRHLRLGLSQQQYEQLAEGEGRVIIASCKADEVSWELDGMNNGLFTHYLLEGLRGKAAGATGEIKIIRLFGYTSDEMAEHIKAINEKRPNSIAQTPWMNAKTEDFVVAIVPPPSVTVDPIEENDTMVNFDMLLNCVKAMTYEEFREMVIRFRAKGLAYPDKVDRLTFTDYMRTYNELDKLEAYLKKHTPRFFNDQVL